MAPPLLGDEAMRWVCLLIACGLGCSKQPGPSTVTGRIPQDGGLDGMLRAYAIDATGAEHSASVVDGQFEVTVPTPGTYSLYVESDAGRIQVLLPRRGRFDANFILAAEETSVRLGSIVALPLDAAFHFVPDWPPGSPSGCGVAMGNQLCVIERPYQSCDTAPQPMPADSCTIDRIKVIGTARDLPGAADGVRYAVALEVPPCAVSDCAPLPPPP